MKKKIKWRWGQAVLGVEMGSEFKAGRPGRMTPRKSAREERWKERGVSREGSGVEGCRQKERTAGGQDCVWHICSPSRRLGWWAGVGVGVIEQVSQ